MLINKKMNKQSVIYLYIGTITVVSRNEYCWWRCGELEPLDIVGVDVEWCSVVESRLVILQKLNIELP